MKNKTVKALAILMTITMVSLTGTAGVSAAETEAAATETEAAEEDQAAADNAAALIDKIYVQERTETTDDDCAAAKEAWDALTEEQDVYKRQRS